MAESKSSLKNIYQSIVSIANIEQNYSYSPAIFSSQYNTVTSLLISKLASIYPTDQSVLDILDPFIVKKVLTVKNGYIDLPEEYRNLLGSPFISAKKDACKECDSEINVTNKDFEELVLKEGCKKIPLIILSQSEFIYRTTSTYKEPTLDKPIGYFSGQRQIKVCPANIGRVEVLFVKKEDSYNYGYDIQPDDTFVYNAAKSKESPWTSAAFEPLFKAIFALYSAYTRDNSLRDWSQIISQQGLI